MNTAVILSYKGLGSNLLHLSYCHQIADKYGPITIITLSNNLKEILEVQIPVITEDAILPVPINPKFIKF